MTKVIFAASVAVLAISAPAAARPGGADRERAVAARDGGQRVDRSAQRAQRVDRSAQRVDRTAQRADRVDRTAQRAERQQVRTQRIGRADARVAARPVRANRVERTQARVADRQVIRANRVVQAPTRVADRQQQRVQQRVERRAQVQDRFAARQDLRVQRVQQNGFARRMPPIEARKLIGAPLATAASISTLNALPRSVSYLYPETPNYYYRYGDGYAYRVDRGSNLISALIPLLAGGYMPGQYLPNNYMNSYVPSSYGFNSFYPDTSYGCNRYANGMVYQVDCVTGMIEGVVPLYAGGYGVGQMLPSAYYNVPNQYRGLYADNSDYGYYYAPGAIYQYDQGSSLITSVAALLSPGFGIGQQLPMGYNAYNVPYAYRDTYYDTPNNWYRYNNGNIYQVDPTTQLVTAVVASILT